MKIYLIRHGQTDLNKERRLQGRNGLPLNETGIAQAKATAEQLNKVKFDLVFSSPQERAIQTAEIVSNITPITDERLDVFDLGSADGIKLTDIKVASNGIMPDPTIYTGVEDPKHYVARVYNFMDELVEKFKEKDVSILICGHKCTTGCISSYIDGMPSNGNFLKKSIGNAEVKIFDMDNCFNKEKI